jgi:hypothetical protein
MPLRTGTNMNGIMKNYFEAGPTITNFIWGVNVNPCTVKTIWKLNEKNRFVNIQLYDIK